MSSVAFQKCKKIVGGCGFAPDPMGSLQRSPDLQLCLRGPTSRVLLIRDGMGEEGALKLSMPPGARNPRAATVPGI